MKKIIIFLSISAMAFYAIANEFLMTEKKKPANNLKQEILEGYGHILEVTSKNIELNAKLQQMVYEEVRQSINNDKVAVINKHKKPRLQEVANDLKKIRDHAIDENKKLNEAINLIAKMK